MRLTPLRLDNELAARKLFQEIGVSRPGTEILSPKAIFHVFKIEDIRSWEANIIKQELLSLGADAALNRDVLVKKCRTDIIIFATRAQLKKLALKLSTQPFDLKAIGKELTRQLNGFNDEPIWYAGKKNINLSKPVVCGIINVTPDSFSGDGLMNNKDIVSAAVTKAKDMCAAGAHMLDIGAESSRPFSKPIGHKEEIKRLLPVLKAIRKALPKVVISIDTYRCLTAQACFDFGMDIVNDITALRHDKKMASFVAKKKLGAILMHMQKDPATMQIAPVYKNVIQTLLSFFKDRLEYCLEEGIDEKMLAIDPGIGFGKTVEDNLKIVDGLDMFKVFSRPVFIGVSRKSFIAKTLNIEENRLIGTVACNVMAFANGANIFRVHDVAQTRQALDMAYAIKNNHGF